MTYHLCYVWKFEKRVKDRRKEGGECSPGLDVLKIRGGEYISPFVCMCVGRERKNNPDNYDIHLLIF